MHAGRIRKLVILLLLVTAAPAFAANPSELFADGNRLFKEDLYWAALLRYRQAQDAGLSTPQLHYNMGVANYKAEQWDRARDSFLESSRYSGLAIISWYNLGLTEWRAGNIEDSLKWLRRARDQQDNRKISSLAKRAMSKIAAENIPDEPVIVKAQKEEERRDVSTFNFAATVGGGVDTNVFRTPAEPYIDESDPNLPLVTPEVQEGFFIPAYVNAKYSVQSFENESFFGAYRGNARFYQDQALENGNEYIHELSFGTEYEKRKEDSKREIFSAFTIAQHDEVYYDRDTGAGRTVDDVDITDRYNYFRYGPEFWARQSFKRLSLGLRGKAQIWNYENTEEVPEYDHNYFLLGMNVQYRFTQTSLIRFTADAYQRHFGDRPSFELDGTQPIGTPPVEYDYLEFGVTARQRITQGLWFGIDFVRTEREDGHVGYNNYIKNTYGGELHWAVGNRFDFEVAGAYQIYDYENAFAFQNPASGRKTLERTYGTAAVTFRMTRGLVLISEYRYEDVQSNDARIAYNRSQLYLGLRWEYY